MSSQAPCPADLDDPLAPVSARFSTGRARADLLASDEAPSGQTTRPFSLRFAIEAAPVDDVLPQARYCDERQMMVTSDGVPTHVNARTRTTVGTKDGGKSPMEDWTYDSMLDAAS